MKNFPGKAITCVYDTLGPVRVLDDGTKRYLTFGDDDEQSCMIKASPALLQYDYNRVMMLVLLFCQPKNISVFGLGGGSLPHCLWQHFSDAQITVVELRQVVIDTAFKYFYLPVDPRLNVINANALTYLADAQGGQCDLLFSDLFLAKGLELRQLSRVFIDNVCCLLADNGWLVINCLEEYRTEKVLKDLLRQQFAFVYESITDDGNWVIMAGKQGPQLVNSLEPDNSPEPVNNLGLDNSPESVNSLESDESPDRAKAQFAQAKQLSRQLGFSLTTHLKRLVQVSN
jgi:spermidine synthase